MKILRNWEIKLESNAFESFVRSNFKIFNLKRMFFVEETVLFFSGDTCAGHVDLFLH